MLITVLFLIPVIVVCQDAQGEPDENVTRQMMYSQDAGPDLITKSTMKGEERISEVSPSFIPREVQYTDAEYNLQFEYPCAGSTGEAGIETDGNYIYTSLWNGTEFCKYEMDGTYIENFACGSAAAIRDLAYDGMYFYGGAASTTIFEMDFNTKTVISTIIAPVATRAIAYDDGEDGFWSNNWSDSPTLWDRAGSTLNSFNINGDENFYGFAYMDNNLGVALWGYAQAGSGNLLKKYDLPGGAWLEDFDMMSILALPITGDLAGGLYMHPNIVPCYWTLGGIVQSVCLWGIEMGLAGEPPTVDAGNDATINCGEFYFIEDALATNYSWLQWSTNGDGFFDDETMQNPGYLPGTLDCANCSVELCVTAYPINPCTLSATDCMILHFDTEPPSTAPLGSGTSGDPYLIDNLENLYWLAVQTNAGNSFSSTFFLQTTDIDASETEIWFCDLGWKPIGTLNEPFSGSYDGGCNTIASLYINRPNENYLGLFGVTDEAELKKLRLLDVNITGNAHVGALAGSITNVTSVSYVHVENVQIYLSSNYGGGLVGDADFSSIYRCSSSGQIIKGGTYDWNWIGGLAGEIGGSTLIEESYSIANVTSTVHNIYAGLVGVIRSGAEILNCYARGAVVGTWAIAGGLVGDFQVGSINNCYSTGLVNAPLLVGGFVGRNQSGSYSNNFWDTETSNQSTSACATGKTTVEMKIATTFTDAGWDFDNIWVMDGITNDGYPVLKWQLAPLVYAGEDATVSSDNTYYLNGVAENYASLLWTTNGDGIISNPEILSPEYSLGEMDTLNGQVILCLTAYPLDPCMDSVTDCMTLTIEEAPYLYAGPDDTICTQGGKYPQKLEDCYQLSGDGSLTPPSFDWTTDGDGYFDDPFILDPWYCWGVLDILNGSVTLTISEYPPKSNSKELSDSMILTLQSPPTVYAGADTLICCDEMYTIADALASNYSGMQWSTNGDGAFDDGTLQNPTYFFGPGDCENDSIELCVSANPIDPCTMAAEDCMTIYLQNPPIAFAGDNQTYCCQFYTLGYAIAENYSSLLWTTDGDGTFNDSTILNADYYPGPIDRNYGNVELCLTAYPVYPCVDTVSDCMTLTIYPYPQVALGPDTAICGCEPFMLSQAGALHYSQLLWTTSGTGTFSQDDILDPVYYPSDYDCDSIGSVELCLSADGIPPCAMFASDCIIVTFYPLPEFDCPLYGPFCHYDDSVVFIEEGEFTYENEIITGWDPNVPGTYTVIYSETNEYGCTSSCEVIITVHPPPILACPQYGPFCEGDDSIAFVEEGVFKHNGAIINGWDPSIAGTFLIKYIKTDQYCFISCTDSCEFTISVYLKPEVSCPGTIEICCNVPSKLLNEATPPGGLYSGPHVSQYSGMYYFEPSCDDLGDFEITYTYSENGFCKDSCTFIMRVFGLPIAICPPDFDVCLNDDPIPFGELVFDPGLAGLGNHTIKLYEENACGKDSCTFVITVNPLPEIYCPPDLSYSCDDVFPVDLSGLTSPEGGDFEGLGVDGNAFDPDCESIPPGDSQDFEITYTYTDSVTGCSNFCTFTITVLKNPNINPVVDAGNDTTVCIDGLPYTFVDPYIFDIDSIYWTTSGDGSFDDLTLLNPSYSPGAGDYAFGLVELCINGYPIGNPANPITDCMVLTFQAMPEVYAGADTLICCGDSYTIADALASDYSGLQWFSINGTGAFDDETAQNPTYFFGPGDCENDSVQLGVVAYPIDPCTLVAEGFMTIFLQNPPIVDAGPDQAYCCQFYTLGSAIAINYSSLLWTTDGDGTFNDSTILNPEYHPGSIDRNYGTIELCLTAYPVFPCEDTVTDCMVLDYIPYPEVVLGPDTTICGCEPFTLPQAEALHYSALLWSTTGTGIFSQDDILHPVYYPSDDDCMSDSVELYLYADGIDPCAMFASDCITVTFYPLPEVNCPGDFSVCIDEPQFGLSGATPAGGFYSGLEVSNGNFNAQSAGEGTHIIMYTYTDEHGCTDSCTYEITVNAQPYLQFEPSATEICQGETIIITVTGPGNGAYPYTFEYTVNGLPMVQTIESSITELEYTPIYPGFWYNVLSIADANGCVSYPNEDILIIITPNPVAYAGADAVISYGDYYTIADAMASDYSGLQWFTPNGTGFFTGESTLSPTYHFGTDDALIGEIVIYLTASGFPPCEDVTDCITITIIPILDLGDAPDHPTNPGFDYKTLLQNNGARHCIVEGVYLGFGITPEPDGQPGLSAFNDDFDDGLIIPSVLMQGMVVNCTVIASVDGYLDAWFDFDCNSNWSSPMDHIFASYPLFAGSNIITFNIPINAAIGNTWARLRFRDYSGVLSYDGPALNGEVEDYLVNISEQNPCCIDYGDAPDDNQNFRYATTLANDGARHLNYELLYLGSLVDNDTDGFPSPDALGDDNNGTDDEDGVQFSGTMYIGQSTSIGVSVSGTGFLNAWIDFNADGDWDESNEQIFTNVQLYGGGSSQLSFNIPYGASGGNTYMRFRYNSQGNLPYYGFAQDGEVEDYMVSVCPELFYASITAVSHLIAIPETQYELVPGDVIGVFYTNEQGLENCGGLVEWNGETQVLVAYGDDLYTPDIKEGFSEGEPFVWKVFSASSGLVQDVMAQYDPLFPNDDGTFLGFGFSAVTALFGNQGVIIPQGWSGISSYMIPFNANIPDIFYPIDNTLILLYNYNGMYWPSAGVNSLGVWNEYSGYVIKLSNSNILPVFGQEVTNKQVELPTGWNIIPVLSNGDVDVVNVFAGVSGFFAAKDVAGTGVFWPQYNINTIGNLKTGKSYYVYMTAPGSITYPGGNLKTSVIEPVAFENVSPWSDVYYTPGTHIVAFAAEATSGFEKGDIIAAFTPSGLCTGMNTHSENIANLVLNGDDTYTEEIDGFVASENISFKLYRPSTEETFDLEVSYDPSLDNTGKFNINSMTAITQVLMAPAGIGQHLENNFRIYPNPTQGVFTVEGVENNVNIIIFNAFGEEIYLGKLNLPTTLDLSNRTKGIYFIRIETDNKVFFEKLIIN